MNIPDIDDDLINFDDENDLLVFSEEPQEEKRILRGFWKLLVVDDDESVHAITKIVLKSFVHDNRSLELLHAYSAKEAIEVISDHPDTSVVLLDVVMERDLAGLEVVKYIRETLKNQLVRIVLRTGQPGHAPEKRIFIDYDINDYKLKTELTEDKLYVTILSAIRSYQEMIMLENSRKGFKKIIDFSSLFFKIKSFGDFSSSILVQLISILNENNNNYFLGIKPSGMVAVKENNQFTIVGGIGSYSYLIGKNIYQVLSLEDIKYVNLIIQKKQKMYFSNKFFNYIISQNNSEILIYLNYNKEFDDIDKDLMDIFSSNITMAIDNIHLTSEIEITQREIIFTLGEIAEARSKETGNHVKRVAEYMKALALKYGIPEETAEVIRLASPLHDVGKLAIPDMILNKPGNLTLEEFEVMKTHSKIGYEMLKNSNREIMKIASIIALQHHEKFNGTGYPSNLKGEDIHIYGRLAALADVFDALGSDRVYKKAWDLDKILLFLKEEKGKHFDPKLIDIFFDNLDEFLVIRDNLADKYGEFEDLNKTFSKQP